MSSKKDNFNSIDKKYMRIAINLAKNQSGLTGSNPSVGCVIEKNGSIFFLFNISNYNNSKKYSVY